MDYYEYYGDSGAATVGQKRTSEQAEIGSKDQDDEKVASKRQKKNSSDHDRDSQQSSAERKDESQEPSETDQAKVAARE